MVILDSHNGRTRSRWRPHRRQKLSDNPVKKRRTQSEPSTFAGLRGDPEVEFFKVPNEFVKIFPSIGSLAELMVILYVWRHTLGFQLRDRGQRISLDEFQHGRKGKGGSRLDEGTGLSKPSLRLGIKQAIEHGFLVVETNDRDKARITKYYQIRMLPDETQAVPDDEWDDWGDDQTDAEDEENQIDDEDDDDDEDHGDHYYDDYYDYNPEENN